MWIKIQAEQLQYLKVTWGSRNGPHPVTYLIGQATLEKTANEARDRLKRLAEWSRGGHRDELSTVLHHLAEVGQRLRYVLFDPVSGVERNNIQILEDWICEQRATGDTELTVTTDASCYVPWALVFDGDAKALDESSVEFEAFADFWGVKYRLSTLFAGLIPESLRTPRGRESFRLISLLNRNEFERAQSELKDTDRDELAALLRIPAGSAFNVEACEQLIQQAQKANAIIYFFGHCRDKCLDLGGTGQQIDVLQFKMLLGQLTGRSLDRAARGYSLVFLNACDTAIGDLDDGFFTATAQPGLCGFVGAEAPIPRDFAIRFGLDFLKSMVLGGSSLRDTIERLRREHWPLSLLYGCYAYPDYRIEPPPHRGLPT